jgi:hypothetical protein
MGPLSLGFCRREENVEERDIERERERERERRNFAEREKLTAEMEKTICRE